MSKPVEIWQGLPPWAKGIIAIAGTAAVAFIGYKIYKAIDKTDAEKAAQKLTDLTDDETKANVAAGMQYSYPQSEYVAQANQIYEGMKYGVGDDYGSVRDTLMLAKNDLDVNQLVTDFGKRQAYVFGIPEGDEKDLFTFVKSELGSEWFGLSSSKLDAVNADWAKKGITYQI